jgi:hypothetical protein
VLEFDKNGFFVRSISGGGLSGSYGLAFGRNGDLYVASEDTASVLEYNGFPGADFQFRRVFVQPQSFGLSNAAGLAFGRNGDLFVSSFGSNEVLLYDGSTGAPTFLTFTINGGGLSGPTFLVFGPTPSLVPEPPGAVLGGLAAVWGLAVAIGRRLGPAARAGGRGRVPRGSVFRTRAVRPRITG